MALLSKRFLSIIWSLLAAFTLSDIAAAEPLSLMRETQTGRTKADLMRAANLSDAAMSSSEELRKHLLQTPAQDCLLVHSCQYVATEIVAPLISAFANFSALARWIPENQVDQEFVDYFRETLFDPIARLQHALHKSYDGPTSGNFTADLACEDVLTTYRVLMNQIVARYQIGIGESIGLDRRNRRFLQDFHPSLQSLPNLRRGPSDRPCGGSFRP